MAFQVTPLLPRKRRRRRRRPDKPAISARLLLDESMKGEIGVISDDLFADLFPFQQSLDNGTEGPTTRIQHVAVTPWLPNSILASSTVPWTVLPVKVSAKKDVSHNQPHSSLRFPGTALGLQSFLNTLHAMSPNKILKKDTPIEVRILDAVPLGLDTVFVSLDTDALRRLEEVHAKFGGGFGGAPADGTQRSIKARTLDINGSISRPKSRGNTSTQESAWKNAVKAALKPQIVVHTGDSLPLPIPSHPITHVAPPPAKITACEPVSQGILLPSTKIVILRSHGSYTKSSRALSQVRQPSSAAVSSAGDEDEDTSNEQFYSAAEERFGSVDSSPPDADMMTSSADNMDSELSGTDTGDLSDDEDMISLNAPMLPPQSSGVLSSFTAATPRPGGFHGTGIATPGSVFSSFTATTARGPTSRSRVFKSQGLLERIPDDLVHPKPGIDDDDEARVFVDTNTLVKVGCFSGDWVKLEVAADPGQHGLGTWGLGNFGNDDEDPPVWRVAKIYGLPENLSRKAVRYPLNKAVDRRSSFSGLMQPAACSQAYLSPVLLANLGEPSHLRISPLAAQQAPGVPRPAQYKSSRIASASLPPVAKEVTLLKLSTPLSTERSLQPSLFAGLKNHFESRRRIVKSGDIIGIAIDETLGKAIFQASSTEDELGNDELLARSSLSPLGASADSWNAKNVAWFKVGIISTPSEQKEGDEGYIWGGLVCVDPTGTKMVQAGSEQGKAPGSMSNSWQYYLGVKRAPPAAALKGTGVVEMPKPYVTSLRRRLRELISAATSQRAIHLGLPPVAILLTSTQRQIGKAAIASRACEDLGLHVFNIDSFDIVTEVGQGGGDVKTEAFLKARAERGLSCGAEYTALLIKHVDALNADRMVTALKEVLADSRVLIATTTDVDKVPEGIRGLFTHELEMTAPDEGEREGILRGIIEDAGIRLSPDIELGSIAVKTAALVAGDLVDVVERALVAKQNRLETLADAASKMLPSSSLLITIKDIELAGGPSSHSLIKADLDIAVEAARKNFADSIGAPKIPNVTWSDVGGLSHVKDAVMDTIQLPLSRPELFAKGMKKRSGILFYGPPGTGKTLLAKAIATEFSLNFFSVKGPELLNMYIGESEANVRRVFQRARDARPCVVFFDELDSVAPKRGNQGDSGGVMDRIVSQLLAELDGMSDGAEGSGGVFVIGATNRPDLLDQALLRPGRFDKMLYLGISDTHEKQLTILQALTRKFTLDPSLSLPAVAESLPFNYTGADLYALCSDAMLKAITRQARVVDAKVQAHNVTKRTEAAISGRSAPSDISIAYFFDHLATQEDSSVMVTEQDFHSAVKELVPSVSMDELRHYESVRKTFEGNGNETPAATNGASGVNGVDKHNATTSSLNLTARGKGKGKGKGVGGGYDGLHGSEEDDYVIRTDHLVPNGERNGKGKGKSSADISSGFGDAAEGDEEELYG